jgi:hypothetical protein
MLRFKILVSTVPLIVAVVFARGELLPGPQPCIAIGQGSVQIASIPWQAQLHVSFTADPAIATVRVQIADSAETADFAVVDDVDSPGDDACASMVPIRFVAISASSAVSAPVIYLSPDGPADYRIFVRSRRFTAREAAALVVSAGGGSSRIAAASL